MSKAQDRDRIEQAIGECKGVLKHAWYPSTTDRTPEFGTYIANRCERCGAERLMSVGAFGQRITGWRYIFPDKHLYRSITAESMDEWRAKYLNNLINKMNADKSKKKARTRWVPTD